MSDTTQSQPLLGSHYLVDFAQDGAGVYTKNQCTKVKGNECTVKFGVKNYKGTILFKGSYQDCREHGIEVGAFRSGEITPPPRFHYVKGKTATNVSEAHAGLLAEMSNTSEDQLSQIDSILTNEFDTCDKENDLPPVTIKRKSAKSTINISKKAKNSTEPVLLSIHASKPSTLLQTKAPSIIAVSETPMNPSLKSIAINNNNNISSVTVSAVDDMANTPENLSLSQVKIMLKQQEDRWSQKFNDLSTKHDKLKNEIKKIIRFQENGMNIKTRHTIKFDFI